MNDDYDPLHLDEKTMAIRQALKYAEDLAQVHQEEKSRRKALEIANQKLRAIIDGMSDGMVSTTPGLTVLEANIAASRMFDTPVDAMKGQALACFLGQDMVDGFNGLRTAEPGKPALLKMEVKEPKGRNFMVLGSPITGESGHVFVIHDITREARMENLKNDFLAIISHELLTPLNGIVGFTEILSDVDEVRNNPELTEYVQEIQQSGNRMWKIVDELLRFAQMTHRSPRDRNEPIPVDEMMNKIFATLEPERRERQASLSFRSATDRPVINGEPGMIHDLFFQLVENALRFGKDCGRVTVTFEQLSDQNLIQIQDDGPGIPAAELDKVFTSFYQVDTPMTRSQGGLGLGLSLARHVARRHNGDIEIQSDPGQGTTCRVTLPKETGERHG